MRSGDGSTTARGYGWQHQKARAAALAAFARGQPCARCDKPMWDKRAVELDHDDDDRTKYIGLSHDYCNRKAGGQKSHDAHAPDDPGPTPFGFWSGSTWTPTSEQW